MRIRSLTLTNFRSYKSASFNFDSFETILVGSNASGKTSILEGIVLLSTAKGFRSDHDYEMIAFGSEVGRVRGEIEITDYPIHPLSDKPINTEDVAERQILEIVLTPGLVMNVPAPMKKYTVNGVPKHMADFAGQLLTVLFWPEDLELVNGSPSLRRKYLDHVLIQSDREYRRNLLSYERGIRQRNRLLEMVRDEGANPAQLLFWDQLLIKNGNYITKKREEYISYINNYQFQITNYPLMNNQITYDRSIISEERLYQYKNAEVASGTTLVGPHRDDIKFKIKNHKLDIKSNDDFLDLKLFGSRGEQRLAILWVKLAELSYLEKVTGDNPILLLDDIFSELDHVHQDLVFKMIGNHQTILTTTDENLLKHKKLKNSTVIRLPGLTPSS